MPGTDDADDVDPNSSSKSFRRVMSRRDYAAQCCRIEMDATGLYRKAVSSGPISTGIPGVRLAPATVEEEQFHYSGYDAF